MSKYKKRESFVTVINVKLSLEMFSPENIVDSQLLIQSQNTTGIPLKKIE